MNRTHPLLRRARRIGTFVIAFAVGLWVADGWMRLPQASADDSATTRPAAEPTTQKAARPTLPPEVAAVAQRVQAAYAKTPLRTKATLTHDFAVAGMTDKGTHAITGMLASPDRFRSESKDELVVVSDDKTLTVFDVASNSYLRKTAADGEAAPKVEGDARAALAQQNPAMLIAIDGDAASIFAPDADAKVELVPASADAEGTEAIRTTLKDGVVITFVIDSAKSTLRDVTWDFAGLLKAQGATNIERATASLRYDETTTGGDVIPADQLAFTLPAGAREATDADPGELLADAGGGSDPSAALTGKPAPEVKLKDLDGNEVVAVGDGAKKDEVIVLDFWATWCPPCVAGLPHVNAVAEKFKDRGVRVYAVNQQEETGVVRTFIDAKKLKGMTTLLDADGEVGKRYRVRGIPQTVIIGRDGNVRKVIVGFGPGGANALEEAVENALK